MRRPLSHEEAVREVYRLTPQIRDYDEFMYMGVRWMPYTMFFQHANYRSAAINTDSLGFRVSHGTDGALRVSDLDGSAPVNLVVGGSTVLGTGATADRFTLASCLSRRRNETWLNFSCRGYNATQELLLFLMHRHRFSGGIGHVIVFSGINTLALEGLPEEFSSDHGRYYYSFEFAHYMDRYNRDLQRRSNTYGSQLERRAAVTRLREWFGRLTSAEENPTDKVIVDEDVGIAVRVARAADATARALEHWRLLLAPFGARLTFALQPMASWTKDRLSPEEEEVFHAIDSCPNNFWRLFGHILGPEVYSLYAGALREGCERNGVEFIDMNARLRAAAAADDYIFVDRVHFNDPGHELVASLLCESCAEGPRS
jgi:hypothetical protein